MHKFEVYEDKADEWRWRKEAHTIGDEYELVADSGEGYDNFLDCFRQAVRDARSGDKIIVPEAEYATAKEYLDSYAEELDEEFAVELEGKVVPA